MPIEYFFMPFVPLFNFMRSYMIDLYGFQFTFMDVIVWVSIASVVIWFITEIRNG